MSKPRSLRPRAWRCCGWLAAVAVIGAVWGVKARADSPLPATAVKAVPFQAEIRRTYTTVDGLPDDDVWCVATDGQGAVLAGTSRGLATYDKGRWTAVAGLAGAVSRVASHGQAWIVLAEGRLCRVLDGRVSLIAELPQAVADARAQRSLVGGQQVLVGTADGLLELRDGRLEPVDELNRLLGGDRDVRQVAAAADGRLAVAAAAGLFLYSADAGWRALDPHQAKRSWAPRDVRGVAFDSRGRLWFASPQGAGVCDAQGWTLYTGQEGLPYDDFSTIRAGADGAVWFGTTRGAIRFDGRDWQYRAAPAGCRTMRCARSRYLAAARPGSRPRGEWARSNDAR